MSKETFFKELSTRAAWKYEDLIALCVEHLHCTEEDARFEMFEAWVCGEIDLVTVH